MTMLGKTVRDRITGFSGIVTGHASYLSGCDRFLVQPKVKSDGSFQEGEWFDEPRLDLIGRNPGLMVRRRSGEGHGAD